MNDLDQAASVGTIEPQKRDLYKPDISFEIGEIGEIGNESLPIL